MLWLAWVSDLQIPWIASSCNKHIIISIICKGDSTAEPLKGKTRRHIYQRDMMFVIDFIVQLVFLTSSVPSEHCRTGTSQKELLMADYQFDWSQRRLILRSGVGGRIFRR